MANGNANPQNVLGWVAGLLAALIAVVVGIKYSSNIDSDKAVLERLSSHEIRITKTETCLQYMADDIKDIKLITKEIRDDQKRREKRGQ